MLRSTFLALVAFCVIWISPVSAAVSGPANVGPETQTQQQQQSAANEEVAPPEMPADMQESTQAGPPSLFDDGQQQLQENHAFLFVRLHTPNNRDAVDAFTLYPYPVKPPVCEPLVQLPLRYPALKRMIMNIGYLNRPNPDKPYQSPNWRFVFAYKVALHKSGMSEPHTIFSQYQFADQMVPFVWKECKARNLFEKQRRARYDAAVEEWERLHVDAENAATNQGLMPIAMKHRTYNVATGQLPAGNWWLQVTRKVPGLKFYWLKPITVTAGQKMSLNLNENDALAILGAW